MVPFAPSFQAFLKAHGAALCSSILVPLVESGKPTLEGQGWRAGEVITESVLRSRSGAWLCRVRQPYTDNEDQVQFQFAAVIYGFNGSVALQLRTIAPDSARTRSGDDEASVRTNIVYDKFEWLPGFEGNFENFLEWLSIHGLDRPAALAKVQEACSRFEAVSTP